jgi:uncharacterized Zn-finger protein
MISLCELRDLCRLCAIKTTDVNDRLCIFDEHIVYKDMLSKIGTCLPIKIVKNDPLPKIICMDCARKVEIYNDFRNCTLAAENFLFKIIEEHKIAQEIDIKEEDICSNNQPDFITSNEEEVGTEAHEINNLQTRGSAQCGHQPEHTSKDTRTSAIPFPKTSVEAVLNLPTDQFKATESPAALPPLISVPMTQQHQSSLKMNCQIQTTLLKQKTTKKVNCDDSTIFNSPLPMNKIKSVTAEDTYLPTTSAQNMVKLAPQTFAKNSFTKPVLKNTKRGPSQISSSLDANPYADGIATKLQMPVPTIPASSVDHSSKLPSKTSLKLKFQSSQQPHNVAKFCIPTIPQKFSHMPHKTEYTNNLEKGSSSSDPCHNAKPEFAFVDIEHIVNNKNVTLPSPVASDAITDKTNVPNPLQNYEEKKEFPCTECEKVFKRRYMLKMHLLRHSGNRPFECIHCGKRYFNTSTLNNHIRYFHEKYAKFICSFCGKKFNVEQHFQSHIYQHTGELPFECHLCDKKFRSKYTLKGHVLSHSAEEKSVNFKCDECGKTFKLLRQLQDHKKIHSIPLDVRRKFKCNFCNKSYTTRRQTQMHLLSHTGELPYHCTLCQKSFKTKKGLEIHLLIHSGKKQYTCEKCGKSFALRGTLKCHMTVHTGERAYQCKLCDRKFTQKSSLNVHTHKHHSKNTGASSSS